nr:MAG TPA: hypothetical protein [Caudoviricetes sp.]DAS61526.1 MAG TPA: hypothetical protein [Caudoviricetes sp.]
MSCGTCLVGSEIWRSVWTLCRRYCKRQSIYRRTSNEPPI